LTGTGRTDTLPGFTLAESDFLHDPLVPGVWFFPELLGMTWLKSPVLLIVATQLLFTTGDLLARANMRHSPFALSTFLSWWFLLYFAIRQVAMFGQLYVFSALQLGRTMALFGATSIVVVNVLGILLLGEVLSTQAYLAIGLVILGFIVLSMSP
jgi:uncharacterized membrane protein